MWNIGNIEIKNKVVLAPMAGISNYPYMKICQEMGVGYAVTELISSEAIFRDNQKTFEMLKGLEKLNIPIAIQIFGSDPNTMANAAKKITERYPNAIIDINMGCPVPKVAIKNEAGSALLKNPEKIYEIVKKVVQSVDVPVTVKIRSGWDENSINAVEVAKLIEKAGASAIAVHARTRKQGYSGKSNWNIIKDVVESVNIPVIGNGDVLSCEDAKKMLDETGCDAVMIGRGLLGNPWLIKECNEFLENNNIIERPSFIDKINMMKRHLHSLMEEKGENRAVLEIRSHFLYYLKGMPNNASIKNEICKCKTEAEILKILDEYMKVNDIVK